MNLTRDNRFLLIGDRKGRIRLFNCFQNVFLEKEPGDDHLIKNSMEVRDISASPTSQKFVTSQKDRDLYIWDIETLTIETRLKGHINEAHCATWNPVRAIIASSSNNNVKLFSPEHNQTLFTIYQAHVSKPVSKLMWNANGTLLMTCAGDCSVKIFDMRRPENELLSIQHEREVEAIAWHTVLDNSLVTGDIGGNIYQWNINRDYELVHYFDAHTSSIRNIGISSSGLCCATIGNDSAIDRGPSKLWELRLKLWS
eukprot:TRINITY_DN4503_c0_g3_i1.p1 TRINITY_DN4503_c0_g3~~TRINITY_DN4503_c0_g3_i1.p1  ORF type:complete len:255 (+),score=25.58 TRINITY_DN4503_c0_g3_i1:297-1061(+)